MLGSNGSVYTVFKRQIIAGLPITLTAVEMTRFVMSKFEAARLVINTAQIAEGEVFVTKMPVINIRNMMLCIRLL